MLEIVILDLRLVPLHPRVKRGCKVVVNKRIAVVKPLKYLTFMKCRPVIQMVFTSLGIPFLFAFTFL